MKSLSKESHAFAHDEIQVPAIRYEIAEHIFPGVYFLLDKDEVVYIGQSTNIIGRIGEHVRDKNKKFDSFSLLRCGRDWLADVELACIRKFRPKYNCTKIMAQGLKTCGPMLGFKSSRDDDSPPSMAQSPETYLPTSNMKLSAASKYLGLSESTLNKLRMTGEGPLFRKLGRRVFYQVRDLDSWVESKAKRTSTSAD